MLRHDPQPNQVYGNMVFCNAACRLAFRCARALTKEIRAAAKKADLFIAVIENPEALECWRPSEGRRKHKSAPAR